MAQKIKSLPRFLKEKKKEKNVSTKDSTFFVSEMQDEPSRERDKIPSSYRLVCPRTVIASNCLRNEIVVHEEVKRRAEIMSP